MRNYPAIPDKITRFDHIWSIEQILNFFEDVDRFMDQKVNDSNLDEVAARLADTIQYYPASTNACTSAQWWKDEMFRYEFDRVAEALKTRELTPEVAKLAGAMNLKEYIKSRISFFNAMQVKADRVNSSLTHSMDALRSILSKGKEELRIANYAQNV